MSEFVSAAHAKAHLAQLIARVERGQPPIVIQRHGRPVAALVRVEDLPAARASDSEAPSLGALALVDVWKSLVDDDVDAMVTEIYEQRDRDRARDVPALE